MLQSTTMEVKIEGDCSCNSCLLFSKHTAKNPVLDIPQAFFIWGVTPLTEEPAGKFYTD